MRMPAYAGSMSARLFCRLRDVRVAYCSRYAAYVTMKHYAYAQPLRRRYLRAIAASTFDIVMPLFDYAAIISRYFAFTPASIARASPATPWLPTTICYGICAAEVIYDVASRCYAATREHTPPHATSIRCATREAVRDTVSAAESRSALIRHVAR